MLEESLSNNGYAIINFKKLDYLYSIQNIVSSIFPCNPVKFHQEDFNDEQRLSLIKKAKDKIVANNLIKKFLLENSEWLIKLLGPDIDIQSDVYLRVSRPNMEKDFIDWHRDTFYGNTYWELNFWFPVFPLQKGAGLMIVEGSHLTSANNIQPVEEQNSFRSQVTKGSLANELGYLYAPKKDDMIANLDSTQIKLLSPEFGQAILFFTHVAHRAQNISAHTRISIDLRIKNMFSPTNTKSGYFQPLLRSALTNCVEKMITLNSLQQ